MNINFTLAGSQEQRDQYLALRSSEYKATFGLDGAWLEQEDDYDRSGLILIGREGRKVVAGARVNFGHSGGSSLLPLEENGLSVGQVPPQPDLTRLGYAEVSRLAIDADYRKGDTLIHLLDALHNLARSAGAPVVFSICPKAQTRLYRRLCKMHRELDMVFHVFDQIQAPVLHGIQMNLCAYLECGFASLLGVRP